MAVPLSADAFIKALKNEGLIVREVHDWRDHNRNAKGPWGPVNGVMLHHTASATDGAVEYCYTGDARLPGPLCHGVIAKDGTVYLVGNGRANHAGGGDPAVLAAVVNESYGDRPPAPHYHQGDLDAVDGNIHFYGFECINLGDGKDPWPDVQVCSMVKASTAILRAHGWHAKSTIGHLEWSDWKSDPRGAAVDMVKIRTMVAVALALPAGRWHLGGTPPPPKPLTLEQRVARIEAKLGITS